LESDTLSMLIPLMEPRPQRFFQRLLHAAAASLMHVTARTSWRGHSVGCRKVSIDAANQLLPSASPWACLRGDTARDCAGQLRVDHRRRWRRLERAGLQVVLLKATHVCSALDTPLGLHYDAKRLEASNRVCKAAVIDEALAARPKHRTAAHSACSSVRGSHCSPQLRATSSTERARSLEPPVARSCACLLYRTAIGRVRSEPYMGAESRS
jgi:hypothetical protein